MGKDREKEAIVVLTELRDKVKTKRERDALLIAIDELQISGDNQ